MMTTLRCLKSLVVLIVTLCSCNPSNNYRAFTIRFHSDYGEGNSIVGTALLTNIDRSEDSTFQIIYGEVELDSLALGNYSLAYRNVFNEHCYRRFMVTASDSLLDIDISPHGLKGSATIFRDLQPGDTVKVMGRFNNSDSISSLKMLRIYIHNEQYYILRPDGVSQAVNASLIFDFELGLYKAVNATYNCMDDEVEYIITHSGDTSYYDIHTCSWDGLSYLWNYR